MKTFLCALTAVCLLATPSALAAQACTGSPVNPGNGFLQGSVAFTDGAFGYGISGGGMTGGNVILGASLSRTELDNTDQGVMDITGTLGIELPGPDFSLCPAASVGYSWVTGLSGGDVDGFTFGGGLGIGQTFGDELLVTPYGNAALVHTRVTASASGFSATGSETYGQFGAGVTVGSESFYAGPSISICTLEGCDPVLGIVAGAVF